MVMREFKRYDHGSLDFMMAPRHLHATNLSRINTFLSTRLQHVVPRLVAPAAMPPAPEIHMANPPLQVGSAAYLEQEEEMAEALRQQLAASFVSSPVPFDFPTQPLPGLAASPRLMASNAAAILNEGDFPCEHCGKTFMSPYAVNGHKTHSKECSAKGRGLGPRA